MFIFVDICIVNIIICIFCFINILEGVRCVGVSCIGMVFIDFCMIVVDIGIVGFIFS